MCGEGHARGRGVCGGGHAWWGRVCVAGGMCIRGVCGREGMRGRRDGHCSRQYTFYWNAFLFSSFFSERRML